MLNLHNLESASNQIIQTWNEYHDSTKSKNFQNHRYENLKNRDSSSCRCYIIPPYLQNSIKGLRLLDEHESVRHLALIHENKDEAFREKRKAHYKTPYTINFQWPHGHLVEEQEEIVAHFNSQQFTQRIVRSVYDCRHMEKLPGHFVMSTVGIPSLSGYRQKGTSRDDSAIKALENALNVFLFYIDKYQYNSIDGKGLPITSSIHYGDSYENAFWDGTEMIYGDGSELFQAFVKFLDVVGHEMTHGVTGNRLEYESEAGALNEHFSDVMGYLVYMYVNKLDVNKADWLLADGILQYGGKSYPLRSFKAPGTAYNIPELGKDPQPAKYGDLDPTTEDNGGVHINSGIPNHAFYLFAMSLGGYAWEKAGFIWFKTMMTPGLFKPNAKMKNFALATIKTADQLFPNDTTVKNSIRNAWKQVEVIS